jgi:hypothetical protein
MYRRQFEQYQNQYRRITSGRYLQDFNVSNWDWMRLDDHILRTWRSWNQAHWDIQMMGLRASRLIENNPAFRIYVDRIEALGREKQESLKKEEALTRELEKRLQDRRDALEKLQTTNQNLAVGSSGEMDTGALQALNNRILLELAAIQVESHVIEQRRLAKEIELNNIMMEIKNIEAEARRSDGQNLDTILKTTTAP